MDHIGFDGVFQLRQGIHGRPRRADYIAGLPSIQFELFFLFTKNKSANPKALY